MADHPLCLPKWMPGRKSEARILAEEAEDRRLCAWIEAHWWASGFAFGARGWAYVVEGVGIITKGEFAAFEGWLARVRKEGLLDPNCVSDDDARSTANASYAVDNAGPIEYAREAMGEAHSWLDVYQPISWWEGLDTYVEVLVEKIDLKVIFEAVCQRYHVPLTNGKGSSDVNLRRHMLERFRDHHAEGRQLVLLIFGDHDPAGLQICDVFKSNLIDCKSIRGVDFDPEPIKVVRVGLTAEQIERLALPWIDNLETGSGKNLADPKHPDHNKPYVRNYIAGHRSAKV